MSGALTKSAAARALMDGRRRRTEVSRDRIIKAMMELIADGDVSPSAEAVAARAGVAQRSVFRHFANMDTLYQELNQLISAEVRPMMEKPFRATTPEGLLREIIERRSAIYERIMPFKICGDLHRHRSPYLAAQHEATLREQREGVRRALPPELCDDRAVHAFDLLFSFDTWRRLRLDQKLSRPRAKAILEHLAISALRDAQATARVEHSGR